MLKQRLIQVLFLFVAATLATPVLAADRDEDECWKRCRDRKGWLIGFNAGWGGSTVEFERQGRTFTEDESTGFLGGLRGGYAFSNSFALTLEMIGFGNGDENEEWGLGAACVTVTWWPDGSGFFLRAGVGGGGGTIFLEETGETVDVEDQGAALFALGYEWQLGKKFALGVAVEGFGFELGETTGFENDTAGAGGMTVQFNWYL